MFSDRIISQPHAASYCDGDLVASHSGRKSLANPEQTVQVAKLPSGGNQITGLYLPHPAARYVLLFSHGNAEDLGDDLPLLQLLRDAGLAVFAYDYRGYGTSAGKPSEFGVYQDVLAAYEYLVRDLRIPPDSVISAGRSLGAAAAIEFAVQRPVAGLNRARVRCPVLVIHGRGERVVSFSNGQRIFHLAPEPKLALWVDGAGHNDIMLVAGERYSRALKELVALLEKDSR
jgi:fermentation-respiration switch protein FrsA (DUF1100 family)